METLYDRIKILRNNIGYSQEQLALKVGYADKTSIAKIEAGKVDLPQSKIIAFAKALNTTTSYLMDGDEPQTVAAYFDVDEYTEDKLEELKTRLNQALFIRNMKPVDLVEKTGIPKSAISQYMSGYAKPKQDRITLICEALDIQEAWLLGYNVPMAKTLAGNFPLTNKEEESLVLHYRKLNNNGKREATKRVEELTLIPIYTQPEHLTVKAAHNDFADNEEEQKLIEEDLKDLENLNN